MFDFILIPVSAILWFWHKVFGTLLGPDNGAAWALSVFFLVFSLRVLLLKPAIHQLRSARKMQKFAPQIQKMREKYKNDRQRQAQEMQKLQSEHGVSPLGGCLPALVQVPVFLSLFWVLQGFAPGKPSNYFFGKQGVDSFIEANLFGAKLSNWITQPAAELEKFDTTRPAMIMVGVPLMIIASVATFFTMRMSMKRQTEASMANPQTAMMGKVMMYLAPVGALVSGPFLPIAVLLYWLANNAWTLGQQHFLANKIDREQQREKEREIAAKKEAPRPKPGQKPQAKSNGPAAAKPDGSGKPQGSEAQEDEPSPAREEQQSTTDVAASTKDKPSPNGGKPSGQRTGGHSGGKSAGKSGAKPAGKKPPPKNRPGKQAGAKKSQKKRR